MVDVRRSGRLLDPAQEATSISAALDAMQSIRRLLCIRGDHIWSFFDEREGGRRTVTFGPCVGCGAPLPESLMGDENWTTLNSQRSKELSANDWRDHARRSATLHETAEARQ